MICTLNCGAQIITTVAGDSHFVGPGSGYFCCDGYPATAAGLNRPVSVAIDSIDDIYIADEGNGRIRMINTSGIIYTIAGSAVGGYRGDDSAASLAEFCDFGYIFINNNNLYIPDVCNNRVRKIDLSIQIITTWAGNGLPYCFGDTGLANAAMLNYPFSVDADYVGNMYVSDGCNYVYKVGSDAHISRVAGSDSFAGCSGDFGPATAAQLNGPVDIVHDKFENFYISDLSNNVIRKVDIGGNISKFAGIDTTWGYSGDNGPATNALLDYPEGITCDGEGNVFFSDQGNNVIRRIDHYSNVITTVVGDGYGAGTGGGAFSGDNGPATNARLNGPAGLTFDKYGNLYIADWLNNRIRKVTNVGVPLHQPVLVNPEIAFTIYPNPAKNTLMVSGAQGCTCQIINLLGQVQKTVSCSADKESINISDLPPGQYIVEAISADGQRRRARLCKYNE